MSDRGIRDALAPDHHFAAAGFVVVPNNRGGAVSLISPLSREEQAVPSELSQ